MASPIVKEGFQVEETTWGIQRPPLGVKTSALNEKFKEAAEIKALHGSVGINGLLKLCNIKSTCQVLQALFQDYFVIQTGDLTCYAHPGIMQVSMVTDGTGQPKLPASSIVVAGSTNLDPRTRRLIRTVSRGLRAEQEPEAAVDGLGGTYFFMNESGERAALMKPCDEEPLAPNNPKGFVGRQLGDPGMKPSVKVQLMNRPNKTEFPDGDSAFVFCPPV